MECRNLAKYLGFLGQTYCISTFIKLYHNKCHIYQFTCLSLDSGRQQVSAEEHVYQIILVPEVTETEAGT